MPPLTNDWTDDWDEIGSSHIFSTFRSMACHIYYTLGSDLTGLLVNINASHPMITREMLVEKFKEMDLPLRAVDKGRR